MVSPEDYTITTETMPVALRESVLSLGFGASCLGNISSEYVGQNQGEGDYIFDNAEEISQYRHPDQYLGTPVPLLGPLA